MVRKTLQSPPPFLVIFKILNMYRISNKTWLYLLIQTIFIERHIS